eukprot:7659287-Prorocentrum_lima.AAC.1
MTSSLVGSEMCIRDRHRPLPPPQPPRHQRTPPVRPPECRHHVYLHCRHPVSYTHLTLPTICSV